MKINENTKVFTVEARSNNGKSLICCNVSTRQKNHWPTPTPRFLDPGVDFSSSHGPLLKNTPGTFFPRRVGPLFKNRPDRPHSFWQLPYIYILLCYRSSCTALRHTHFYIGAKPGGQVTGCGGRNRVKTPRFIINPHIYHVILGWGCKK